MINTSEIVKNYIEKVIKGEALDLEIYVKELFKGIDKVEIKEYCNKNIIYFNSKDNSRVKLLTKIYGSCNRQLGAKILMTTSKERESEIDFYKRIYVREYM